MDTAKLQEALADLKQQRSVLDEAIASLQKAIALMSNGHRREGSNSSGPTAVTVENEKRRSYIDDAVEVLTQRGTPLHVDAIVAEISKARGTQVKRGSVESTIVQHMKKFDAKARLARYAPSTYGLPSWEPKALEIQASDRMGMSD